MTRKLLFVSLLLLATIGSKAEVIYSFNIADCEQPDDFVNANASSEQATNQFTIDGVTWLLAATPGITHDRYTWTWYASFVNLGSSSYFFTECTVSTSALAAYSIDQITVNTRGGSSTEGTLAVSVGGVPFTCTSGDEETTEVSLTSTFTDYVFESSAGAMGEIVITYTQPSSTKYPTAFYLSAITVGGEEGTPATEGTFTITDTGYATYYTDTAYIMPAGVVGTTVSNVSRSTAADGGYMLTMPWEYAAGDVVPAYTALVIRGEEGDYDYTITTTDAVAADNLLYGSLVDVETFVPGDEENSDDYYFYELSHGLDDNADVLGFYWGDDTGGIFVSEAHKAWMAMKKTQTTARALIFAPDDPTAIVPITAAPRATTDGIYTLQGVRVATADKPGVYIINGKKTIVH